VICINIPQINKLLRCVVIVISS